jgi:hypothetical protein
MGAKLIVDLTKARTIYVETDEGKRIRSNIYFNVKKDKVILKKQAQGTPIFTVPKALLDVELLKNLGINEPEIKVDENTETYVVVENQVLPVKGIEIEKPKLTKSEEKKKLKVYETPEETLNFFAEVFEYAYVNEALRRFRKALAEDVRNKRALKVVADALQLSPEKFVDFLLENRDKRETLIKAVKDESIVENFIKKLEAYEKARDFLTRGEYKQALHTIYINYPFVVNIYKDKAVALFDPQAGSGRILKIFKNKGVKAKLFGTELRDLFPEDEDNRVVYGVDFSLAKKDLSSSVFRKKVGKKQIAFLNPPYTADWRIERETLSSLPEGMPVMGIMSHKYKNLLNSNIEGVFVSVPMRETGYTEEENPEYFYLFIGKVKRGINKNIFLEANSLSEALSKVKPYLNEFGKTVFEAVRTLNEKKI